MTEQNVSNDTLNNARKLLTEALGEKTKAYFDHMKLWFKMKISKEDFDSEARRLLLSDQVHLHNEFFLAILNKVDGLAEITSAQERTTSHVRSNSKRHKHSSKGSSDKSNFEVVDILDYMPQGSPPGSPPGSSGDYVKYASQEYFLPDHALVTGRFMLTAWEQGLEGADDETIEIVVTAVQVFLKNILTAIITQRKGYKVRQGNFIYDIGCEVPNMWLKNTDKLIKRSENIDGITELDENGDLVPSCPMTIDEAEQITAHNLACSAPHSTVRKERISMQEVYDTLKVHKNVIASHSVYAVNMERIATLLCHPSY